MSAFVPRKLSGRRLSGAGSFDGCDRTDGMTAGRVRRLMTDAGLWIPRRQCSPKVYQPRVRRTCPGD
ncbi:hypothetical protein A8H40_22670 [Burkholderia multivorans]|nr:hypothetical protein A8H40_22670 [Burkholderia multivorans]